MTETGSSADSMAPDSGVELSVVIPAHDAADTIDEQLAALVAEPVTFPIEIIVVDNRSTDGTADRVGAWAARDPRVRLVAAPDGAGPSYARNVGIAAARAELVACCDADDVVAAGWIGAMRRALGEHRFVAGALELDRLNAPWVVEGRGRSIANGAMRHGDVVFAHGCNLGVHRDLFLAHRLDEGLRAGEEIDLALRLAAVGVHCAPVPDAIVHYRYRTTLRATWRQSFIGARVRPHLDARLGRASGPRLARRVAWLVGRLPWLVRRAFRIRWTWVAAGVAGELAGRRDARRTP